MYSPGATYDLVVVGASFAGLVAARTAAMRGLKVAVLDAKQEAGHRVATTGILVKEAVEEIDIPHALTRRIYGVRLYAPNLKHVDLFAPGYFFLTTDTACVLRWLAQEAQRAGVDLLWRAHFDGASREGALFRFANPDICARYVLGADGARSAVARHFGLGRNTRFLTGIEYEYDGLSEVDPRFLHCFLNSDVAPGYLAWAAPGPSVVQLGLAVGPRKRPDLARFLGYANQVFHFDEARVVGAPRWPHPMRRIGAAMGNGWRHADWRRCRHGLAGYRGRDSTGLSLWTPCRSSDRGLSAAHGAKSRRYPRA